MKKQSKCSDRPTAKQQRMLDESCDDESEPESVSNVKKPPRPKYDPRFIADNYFDEAIEEVHEQRRQYGKPMYGNEWFTDEFRIASAVNSLRKFSNRAARRWLDKESAVVATEEKIMSDAIDMATYALFYLAILIDERRKRET